MKIRCALDTNLMVYVEGVNDLARRMVARRLLGALELAATHQLAIWDAMVLAGAAQAGCRTLLSEDMRHGFTWRGVTVRNPFRPDP